MRKIKRVTERLFHRKSSG